MRKPDSGRFTVGTKLLHRSGKVPKKIQDILIGCLLGDAYGEKTSKAITSYFVFRQGMIHAEYLYFLYFTFAFWGYTSSNVPIPQLTKDGKGNSHQALRFRTLSIPSLSWIYNMFYSNLDGKTKKIVPSNLNTYLNPRVLAYWIMDDGSWTKSGILLHCNSFDLSEVQRLAKLLQELFNLRVTIRNKGKAYILYIHAESIPVVRELTLKYMHPKFYYKIGIK